MKILIVEDDALKMKDVQHFVEQVCDGIVVDTANSYAHAVDLCYNVIYDFVILDMNIPWYDSDDRDKSIIPNGGEMIVRELASEDIWIRFAFLSQYETIGDESVESFDQRMKAFCPHTYCGFIFFEVNDDGWKDQLFNILKQQKYA